jgi:hypothetical protein
MAGLFALNAGQALSQGVTTSAVSGTVTTAAGQPVVAAQVSVTDLRTGVVTGTLSDEQGRYFVPHLSPGGPYVVRAELIGYRASQRENVRLTLSQTERIDFELEQTAVELEGLSVSIERSDVFGRNRTGAATTIGQGEIETLPTISRSFVDFAQLSPYITPAEAGAVSVAGQNNRFNNIQIDGAVNNDVFGLADSGLPGGQGGAKAISLEAIQEFQILTAPFDVRQSGFTGGLINAVTKSGTNQLSGSLFGFHTNQALLSELDDQTNTDFNDTQFGFSLGGPLIMDQLHFFVNGEFEIQDSPNPGPSFSPGGSVTSGARDANIHPDSAARVIDVLEGMGFDVGTTEAISLDNPRTNLFARLDWSFNERHRAVFRHNYSRARRDLSAFRTSSAFALSSNLAPFTSTTNSSVFQLFSRFGSRWNNELLVNLEFVRDKRDPAVTFPQIEVGVRSEIDGATVTSEMIAGAERFSQANTLDQDVIQLTNNLTGRFGDHTLTFGTHNELFGFSNTFFEGSIGIYQFDSVEDLAANQPSLYQIRTIGSTLSTPATEFSVLSLGGYVQDEWAISRQLNLMLGLRLDMPIMLDDPPTNPAVSASDFGQLTSEVPSGNLVFQPRFGFNWNSLGDRETQIRGGLGLFAGRAPYVWISNAYGNTGLESTFLTCNAGNIPALNASNYPGSEPRACLDGSTGAGSVSFINLVDPDFKFPVDLKVSAGIDQDLGNGFSVTGEILYTKSIEQVAFEELNLVGQQGTDASQGGRPIYGVPSANGFNPVRVDPGLPYVVRVTNSSDNRALLLSGSLQGRYSDWLSFRGSYTYSKVEDTQGLFSSQATSNYGRNAIGGDPNDPALTSSSFERPHKVVLSATGSWQLGGGFNLAVTPQYFGQSGQPYSFIVREDVNGDGYRGPGVSRDNDLIYIPGSSSELIFRNAEDAAAFNDLIDSQECLSEQRGQIMERNSCRNPWSGMTNLRVALTMPRVGSGNIELVADVINVFASEVERITNIDRGYEVLRMRGRQGGTASGPLQYDYTGPRRNPDTGELTPFTVLSPLSQRQIQVGLRYNF